MKLSLVRERLTTRVMMKVMLLPISVMAVILINCCQHVEGFFPYFQPFPYIRRRPARPQNPIYVQADRISKVWKDKNKLKSLKVAKWRKDEWRMMMNDAEWWRMNEEWWRMKDEWWRMMISSCWRVLLYDPRTDICDCRVAFATEN